MSTARTRKAAFKVEEMRATAERHARARIASVNEILANSQLTGIALTGLLEPAIAEAAKYVEWWHVLEAVSPQERTKEGTKE